MQMINRVLSVMCAGALVCGLGCGNVMAEGTKPTMKEFIGINGHTFQMNASIYSPIAKKARDYHGMNWDVGKKTDRKTTFPYAHNGSNWDEIYGSWVGSGMEVDASLIIYNFEEKDWVDVDKDAPAYGKAFAEYFGPTHGNGLVKSIEIGNETKTYDDDFYQKVYRLMAKGVREADPKIKILTASMQDHESTKYHRNVEVLRDDLELVDVLNVHTYAFLNKWPKWEMTYPENEKIEYLEVVRKMVDWRDKYAKDKEIWITEFGWDSSTKKPDPKGKWKDWVCVTDRQQAQYIARSYLIFASMDIERAYVFWFDDKDKPQLFASSGVTRNGKPKESYWAMEQLQRLLGDYRFDHKLREDKNAYVYSFVREGKSEDEVLAMWSPTGEDREIEVVVEVDGKVEWVKSMAVGREPYEFHGEVVHADEREKLYEDLGNGKVKVYISESPVYVKIKKD
ncbi:hypothetical protein JD969_10345 [Planctomycetota bacterium]|nr:hypothetical protein JD969_10345 [Planctomycetota bacterium]